MMLVLTALLVIVSIGSANASRFWPRGSRGVRQTFSLHATAGRAGAEKDFVHEWAAAHQKWGQGVPESAVEAFSLADSAGRVDVEPLGSDALFIADLEVGNPPQLLKIAVDTGSCDLWVQSTDTEYEVNRAGPWAPRYEPNDSETAHLVDKAEWSVGYVDGSAASGIVYQDSVRLGNFEVHNATIQSAVRVGQQFEETLDLSGILGLAKSLPSNIEPPMPSFLELLRPQLENPVFTIDLRRNASGRFDFGYIDDDLALEDLTWVDSLPGSNHWDLKLDLTSWAGSDSPTGNTVWWYHEFNATVDTGTSLLFLPQVLADMYWFSIPDMRVDPRLGDAYTFPCNIAKNLPDLLFKLPGSERVLRIPGPYLNYSVVKGSPGYCWGGMQSAAGLETIILGDVMLKSLFLGFNLENNKIGFANKKLQ